MPAQPLQCAGQLGIDVQQHFLVEYVIQEVFKELVDTGVVIVGSVDTVIEKLSYYSEVLHAGLLVTDGHHGEIPDYLVLKVQELMAKEVMPHFREKKASVAETNAYALKATV